MLLRGMFLPLKKKPRWWFPFYLFKPHLGEMIRFDRIFFQMGFRNLLLKKKPSWQFFVTFLGWLSDPFQWLSDLQLGEEKVTLNHQVVDISDFLHQW